MLEFLSKLFGGQRGVRRQIEKALHESETRFRLLVEGTKDYALLMLDPAGHIMIWNSGAQRMYGYEEHEIVGRPLPTLYPAEGVAQPEPDRELETATREERYEGHGWRQRKDGSRFWVNVFVTTLRDDAGRLIGFSKVARDCTAQKQAEDLLHQNAVQQAVLAGLGKHGLENIDLQALLNETTILVSRGLGVEYCHVMELLPDGKALVMRAGTGWKENTVGRIIVSAEPSSQAGVALTTEQPVVSEDLCGETRFSVPPFLLDHDIKSCALVVIPGEEGPYGILGAATAQQRAYTSYEVKFLEGAANVLGAALERRQAAEALRKAHDELELRVAERTADLSRAYAMLKEADARKNEFLALLAHELRNPLAPILNALHIMRERPQDMSAVEHAREMVERHVRHMTSLVDDLLDVSRITRDKIELRRERVDLQTVVNHCVETARPALEERQLGLSLSLPRESICIDADPLRLEQIINNLFNNAIKFTEPGGQISLAAECMNGGVLLKVRDTGLGIPTHLLPHIFELFVQGERGLDRTQDGLGIGLTLVRRLVELHGGSVRVFSDGPGQGSEFEVRLPVVEAPPEGDNPEKTTPPVHGERSAAGRRVLVVDDNRDAAESMAMSLKMHGHTTWVAYDGFEALTAAKAARPDVVLLDLGLPGMDGHEVAQRIRQEPGFDQTLLVAITGYGDFEDRRRSEEAGFDLHLVKPVDPMQVCELLRTLERRKATA